MAFPRDSRVTKEQKIIRGKVGILELAEQLGTVSQACKVMGYSRDSSSHLLMRDSPADRTQRARCAGHVARRRRILGATRAHHV
jgi:hypothetical protein